VILLHGFPYDIHAFEEVAPPLAQAGFRVIVPFLRGFGESRFLHADTPRSGQQAVMGYDWGGRADFVAVVSHSCRRRPPPLLSTRCCA